MGARSAWWSSGRGLDKRKSLLPYVIDGRIKGTWTALRHTTALHAQAYRRATVLETLRAMDVLGAVNAAPLWGSKASIWSEVKLSAGEPFDNQHNAGTDGTTRQVRCFGAICACDCAE
jgi:hypothetical protein